MSLRAMLWALYDADCDGVPPSAFRTLLVLADHAGDDGRGAWPKVRTIAEKLRVSDRTVQRHLAALRGAGLIVEGDQELVSHFTADERPKVWDLCITDPIGVTEVSPRTKRGVTPAVATGVTPGVATGVTHGVAQGTVLRTVLRTTPGGGGLRSVHNHEPNARRALAALGLDGAVDELLAIAYDAGDGDPWAGYLAVKAEADNLPPTVRDLPALLRHRLGLSKAATR
jgi:DNA-binding transcriptional ArsR family regulator